MSEKTDDDQAMLKRWVDQRDPQAFAAMVRRHAGMVYGTALRITGNPADAEDVSQECFVMLAAPAGAVGESLGGWLYASARARAMNVLRARGRRRRHEEAAMEQRSGGEGASGYPIDDAIAGLPEELRRVVIGHYLEGRGQVELAGQVGVSQGTISRRIERALEMLRDALQATGASLSVAAVAEEMGRCVAVQVPEGLVRRLEAIGRRAVWPWKKMAAGAVVVIVVAGGVAMIGRPAGTRTMAKESGMEAQAAVQKDSAVVAGVEPLEWKIGNQCTFIGSMRSALHAMGDDISYNELMGVSGAAFRLCFAQPGWDYSSVDGMLSYDHGAVAMKALGYGQCIITGSGNPNEPTSKAVREEICQSIDAGRPVLGIDLVVAPEWGIIAGYEKGGRVWLCRSYFDKEPGVTLGADGFVHSDRWPWIRVVFGPKGKAMSARESLIEAMKVATTFGKEDEFITSGGGGRYARGLTAYRVWAEGLEEEGRYRSERNLKHHWSVNCFCYDALVDARVAAGVFLRAHAGELPGEAGEKVTEAGRLYDQIGQRLQEARGTLVPIYKDGRATSEWTAEMRTAQAELLRGCAELEKRAIGLLGEAVALASAEKRT